MRIAVQRATKKVDNSYRPNNIQFSENCGPVRSVRSALEPLKSYFDK
jgi:hypothetical protein